jgi:hypothetical protein
MTAEVKEELVSGFQRKFGEAFLKLSQGNWPWPVAYAMVAVELQSTAHQVQTDGKSNQVFAAGLSRDKKCFLRHVESENETNLACAGFFCPRSASQSARAPGTHNTRKYINHIHV